MRCRLARGVSVFCVHISRNNFYFLRLFLQIRVDRDVAKVNVILILSPGGLLNHVFKLVWNRALGMLVPVPEVVTSPGRGGAADATPGAAQTGSARADGGRRRHSAIGHIISTLSHCFAYGRAGGQRPGQFANQWQHTDGQPVQPECHHQLSKLQRRRAGDG